MDTDDVLGPLYRTAELRTLLAGVAVGAGRPFLSMIGLPIDVSRAPASIQASARAAARRQMFESDSQHGHDPDDMVRRFLQLVEQGYGAEVASETREWLQRHALDDWQRVRWQAWSSVLMRSRRREALAETGLDDTARTLISQMSEDAVGDVFWREMDQATAEALRITPDAEEEQILRLEVSQPGDVAMIDVPGAMEIYALRERSRGVVPAIKEAMPPAHWKEFLRWAADVAAYDGYVNIDLDPP